MRVKEERSEGLKEGIRKEGGIHPPIKSGAWLSQVKNPHKDVYRKKHFLRQMCNGLR